MVNYDGSLTVIIPIAEQVEDLIIPNHATLSKFNIVAAQVFTGGKAKNGKEHATEQTIRNAHFEVEKDANTKIHSLPLAFLLANANGYPTALNMNKANIQSAKIILNTAENITNKVIEITFFYLND